VTFVNNLQQDVDLSYIFRPLIFGMLTVTLSDHRLDNCAGAFDV